MLLTGSVLFGLWWAAAQSGSASRLAAARQAEQNHNFAEAETIYVQLLSTHPDAELYQRLGLVRHMQNEFAPAADAFRQAIRLDPNLWSSHLFLGIDLYRTNQFAEAGEHLETANRLHPDEPEILFWLGATDLAQNRSLEGFALLESVLARQPNNAQVLRLLAESYAAYGTGILSRLGNQYPDSLPGLIVEAKALEFEGSYDAALDVYRSALRRDPNRPGVQESIARLSALKATPKP